MRAHVQILTLVALSITAVGSFAEELPPGLAVEIEILSTAHFNIESEIVGDSMYTAVSVIESTGNTVDVTFVRPNDGWEPGVHLILEPDRSFVTYVPQISCPDGQEPATKCEWEPGDFNWQGPGCVDTPYPSLCYLCREICIPAPPPPPDRCDDPFETGELYIRMWLEPWTGDTQPALCDRDW